MPHAKTQIRQTTKQLMVTLPFKAITVTTIMKAAGIRRQTFYDYYRDKYDVLGDIYRTEIDADVWYCGDYHRWPATVSAMLAYFSENRDFYQRALTIDEQNAPAAYIEAHLTGMIDQILGDMARSEAVPLTPAYREFLTAALTDACMGTLRRFLLAKSAPSLAATTAALHTLLADNLSGLLARLDNDAKVSG